MRGTKRKYHYFYKIINTLNGHFYYGVHNTDNLDDGYMGSGTRLKYAYKKYGVDFFEKEILKFFNSAKEAFEYEAEIVTEELVHNPDCYNVSCGGGSWNTLGTTTVRDKDGNYFRVDKDDPRYLSGELTGPTKNCICVENKDGKIFFVDKDDPRYLSGELVKSVSGFLNKKHVKDKDGKIFFVDKDDPRYLSGELKTYSPSEGKILVKFKANKQCNNLFFVDKDDPRYLSGELISCQCGKHHTQETIKKYHETFKRIGHQQGEKNSNYGHVWIMKGDKSICVPKEQLQEYLNDGWIKGRKCGTPKTKAMNNGITWRRINNDNVEEYLRNGWVLGKLPKN